MTPAMSAAWDLTAGEESSAPCPRCRGRAITSHDVEVTSDGPIDDGCLGMAWEETAREVVRLECPECGHERAEERELRRRRNR